MNKILKTIILLLLAAAILSLGLSTYTAKAASRDIAGTDSGDGISEAVIEDCESIDPQCILVLGCAVWPTTSRLLC